MARRLSTSQFRGGRTLLGAAIALLLSVGVGACASGGGGGGTGGSPNRLTGEVLEQYQHLDAYTLIRRIRPGWLQTRTGALPALFIDGTEQMGRAGALADMSVADVAELRFLEARDATTRFGTGYPSGAILVTRR